MSARLENQKRATDAFIDAWRRLSVDDMVKLRTPDCIQESYPKESLGMPDQTNDEWLAALRPAFGQLSNFAVSRPSCNLVRVRPIRSQIVQVDLHSVTHDPQAGRSVVFADTAADATWGDYKNTHIIILTWNEDGTKQTKIQDMMDSAGMLKRMEMMQKFFQAPQTKV